jgi:RNA-directed DNA polymerase
MTTERRPLKPLPVGGAKAAARDVLLQLKLYQLFCNIVGGVISPLLANIALHGLEQEIARGYNRRKVNVPQVIRYADDFVILCAGRKTLEASRERAVQWLKTMGLEMKPSKTRITHTLEQVDGNTGFDFLGFHVRQYKKGKDHSAKGPRGDPLGFKTLITPCPEAVKAHTKKLKAIIRNGRGQPQEALIRDLNPRTRGWSRYYRTVISAKCFAKVDWDMGAMLWRWAKWENSKKGSEWRKTRYWQKVDSHDEFRTEEARLYYHSWTKIQRHQKVVGMASPFDGNLVYWAERLYKGPLTSTRLGKVLRQQKGQCAWCGFYLKDGDLIEVDHFIPKRLGGKDEISNLRAMHRHCHDQKSRTEGQKMDLPEETEALNDNEPD